jgi:hypothetical protein
VLVRESRFSASKCRSFGKPLAERDLGQVNPVVLRHFPDENQVPDLNTSAFFEFCPSGPGHAVGMLRLVLGAHLDDGQVGHIGPLFVARKAVNVQQIMEFTHSIGGMGNPYKYGRSDWDERLNLAERNLEGFYVLTAFLKGLNCAGLIANQITGWQEGDMGCEMRQFRVELTPKGLHELPNGVTDVGYQGVTLFLRHEEKL